ncbi:MAG: acyltransferase, partial [Pseudomonadota bacterium]
MPFWAWKHYGVGVQYKPEIDGLRAVAVVPVILFHAGFSAFGGGFVGVDIFFAISGYLITSIIFSELDSGRFSLARFYERRARRILPALFLVILCCIPPALLLLRPPQLIEFARSVVSSTFFSSNILFWREGGYFGASNDIKPLLHTWSLAVEEQYYIFFPIAVALAYRTKSYLAAWLVALAAIASFAINLIALQLSSVSLEATFFLLPTRAWEILFGAVCALLIRQHGETPLRLLDHRALREIMPAAGLLMIGVSIFAMDESVPFPSHFALLPVCGACLIMLFCTKGTTVYRLLASKVFVWVGLISYSLYLWHQPIFAFVRLATPLEYGPFFI